MDAAISAGFLSESEGTSFQQNIFKDFHYNFCVLYDCGKFQISEAFNSGGHNGRLKLIWYSYL